MKQPSYNINKIKEHSHEKDYVSASGIDELKNLLVEKNSYKNYKVENIILGNGLKELIYLVQLAFKGKIFHITPSWVSYKEQIIIMNREKDLIEIPSNINNNYRINFELLETKLKEFENENKLLIFNNPNNPTGLFQNEDYIKRLSSLINKYNCVVFADEIYFNVTHFNNIVSLAEYSPHLVIRGSSVSKDLACGGYRLGWITFPKELNYLYEICNSYASSIYSCTALPIQYGTYYMLKNEEELNKFYEYNNIIYKFIVDNVEIILNNSNINFVTPNSSWYIFLYFDSFKNKLKKLNINSSHDLREYLLKELNILCVAGEAFNIGGLNLRLSLIDINVEKLNKLEYIDENILIYNKEIFKKIFEGITVLVNFFNNL